MLKKSELRGRVDVDGATDFFVVLGGAIATPFGMPYWAIGAGLLSIGLLYRLGMTVTEYRPLSSILYRHTRKNKYTM